MNKFFRLLLIVLITFNLAQCKSETSTTNNNRDPGKIKESKNSTATKFDIVSEQLISKSELMTEDLIALKIIDTTISTQLSETSYSDTSVQLNDSIYYSIIAVGDQAGVCSYVYLASMNKNRKKLISSKYLYPDCNIDYSLDTYNIYEHSIIDLDKIQLTKTTVFQKKKRTSSDEEENIDHKQIQKNLITILQSGQINVQH